MKRTIDKVFWKNKKVFVTGHTGFKGGWLSLLLSKLGSAVTGYSLPPSTTPNLFEAVGIEKKINSVFGDINDLPTLTRVMQESLPEIVFHLAAQPLVRDSYDDPIGTYETNVLGTARVLEAVSHTPSVKVVVIITTDKCYENKEWEYPYRETDRLGGHDPYAASKACAELVTASYREAFLRERGVAVATVRAGNVIGGGDWSKDRLIPDIMKHLFEKAPLSIRNPHANRPWQHVLDPLTGYMLLAESLFAKPAAFEGAWNFGPSSDAVSVSETIATLSTVSGTNVSLSLAENDNPHEAQTLQLDSSKARSKLSWQPNLDFAQTLSATYAWYRTFYQNKENIEAFTEKQIEEHIG